MGWNRFLGALAAAILSGCASSSPAALPTPPALPDGWQVVAKGDISVALPIEWGGDLVGDPELIVISALVERPDDGVGVTAIGPGGERQPDSLSEADLIDWLLGYSGTETPDNYTQSLAALPTGRSVEVRATYYGGTPHETLVVSYAVPTSIGVAFLQIIVDAELVDRYASTIPVIASLFWFEVSP